MTAKNPYTLRKRVESAEESRLFLTAELADQRKQSADLLAALQRVISQRDQLLAALEKDAVRMLRAAGFAMEGTCSTRIMATISAAKADSTTAPEAAPMPVQAVTSEEILRIFYRIIEGEGFALYEVTPWQMVAFARAIERRLLGSAKTQGDAA